MILMVILGWVELPIRLDLGDDRGIVDARLVDRGNIGFGEPRPFGALREDDRAILRADIGPAGCMG
jgi:hypothetical protein